MLREIRRSGQIESRAVQKLKRQQTAGGQYGEARLTREA
jgi:hypothetical protein